MLLSSYNNNISLTYDRDQRLEFTHEIYDQLLRPEILLHLHPYTVQLEFLQHFSFFFRFIILENGF